MGGSEPEATMKSEEARSLIERAKTSEITLDLHPWAAKIFMASYSTHNELSSRFFKPLTDLYPLSDKRYACSEVSDTDFARLGVLRCISHAKSGHQFLQHHADQGNASLSPDHFFKALKSPRRLTNLTSINRLMRPLMAELRDDPLEEFEALRNWSLFAADGHYQKPAIFDAKKPSNSKNKLTKPATGHFFRLDLRTHHMGHLDLAELENGRKKEHDMHLIKRSRVEHLRDGAPKGHKVLYLWDRACIDYACWDRLKHNSGIYFCTLEKSNSVTEFISDHKVLDYEDPDNEGIRSDQIVATSQGYRIRKIVYVNPEDGVEYVYLTNEMTPPPCLVVLLYKHRWDIEKVFDQFKNKMEEKRSWASSATAKKAHAVFECLAHNLMLLLEDELQQTEGMTDQLEPIKQRGRQKGHSLSKSFINTALSRATQRTQRFIRWLAAHLYREASWRQAMLRLATVWGCS